jgi:phosphate transport system permease protein
MRAFSKVISNLLMNGIKASDVHGPDVAFLFLLRLLVGAIVFIFLGIVVFLYWQSLPILNITGWKFLILSEWDPTSETYGALPFIYGTLVTSLIALVISVPIAVGSALFLTELAPRRLSKVVGFLIEMLAAIPSVVYGLWGIFVLAPLLRVYVQPFLGETLGALPLFRGPPLGVGMMSAGLVLGVMILPTITAVCREVFLAIPVLVREGALTLGATRWESIQLAVLRTGVPGILSAIILGLGRAMGETMAVTMLIGNRPLISPSLFAPGATMASVIANEYPEASSSTHLAALTAVGLTLFIVSLLVNLFARVIVLRYKRMTVVG